VCRFRADCEDAVTAFREAFPIVYVEDVPRSVEFYVSTLGFEVGFRWPAEGDPTFAFLRLPPLGIAVSRRVADQNPGRDFELCVYTDDVDDAAARLRRAGAEEVMPPQDEPWGERRTYFRDRDGTLLHVCAPL
jgi:lactoylglutathione lyase